MNNILIKTCFVIAVAFISTGCAARYGCNAPEGKSCNSISQTYTETLQEANSEKEELKDATEETVKVDENSSISSDIELNFTPVIETASIPLIGTNFPTKSAPRILRIWLAPWEDNDGDLHQPGYIYLQIDDGRWVY